MLEWRLSWNFVASIEIYRMMIFHWLAANEILSFQWLSRLLASASVDKLPPIYHHRWLDFIQTLSLHFSAN